MARAKAGPVRKALARLILGKGVASELDALRRGSVMPNEDYDVRLAFQDDRDYLGAMTRSSWAYACVNAIARNFPRPQWWFERQGTEEEQERVEIPELRNLLRRPTPWHTGNELFEATVVNLLLTGKAFWYLSEMSALSLFATKMVEGVPWVLIGDDGSPVLKQPTSPLRAGQPREIWSLRPDLVKPVAGVEGVLFDHFMYEPNPGKRYQLPADTVVYFRRYDPQSMLDGLGVIEAARVVLEGDQRAAEWNLRFYKNSARPDLVMSTEEDLSQEDHDRYLAMFKNDFLGQANAHRVALLGGGLTAQILSQAAKDMDWLNGRRFSRDEILAMFGVPPALVGIFEQSKSWASVTEQHGFFWGECMGPIMRHFAECVTAGLVSRWDPKALFTFEQMVKADLDKQSQIAQRNVMSGVWSPNEAREEFGWGPAFAGGDRHMVFGMPTVLGRDETGRGLPEPAPLPPAPAPAPALPAGEPGTPSGEPAATPPAEEVENVGTEAPKALAARVRGRRGRGAKKALTLEGQEAASAQFQGVTKDEFITQQRDVLRAVRESEALAELAGKVVKQGEDPIPEIVAGFIDWGEADARYEASMRPVWEGTLGEAGESALGDVGAVGISFDISNPRVQEFLSGYLPELAGGVSTTTRADIARVLSEGIANGESISALEGRVRAVFTDAKVFRAEAIARTETSRAMQQGALEGWRQSQVVEKKEWVVGADPCELCAPMAGEVVGIDEVFSTGGMIADIHPNEQCDIVPIVAEEEE